MFETMDTSKSGLQAEVNLS